MAVHNLRDFMLSMGDPDAIPGYCASFDDALNEAVTAWPIERRKEMLMGLMKREDARRAHPSWEHLLPVFVAAGAAHGEDGKGGGGREREDGEKEGERGDKGERIWTYLEGSLSWAQFRFGKPPVGITS